MGQRRQQTDGDVLARHFDAMSADQRFLMALPAASAALYLLACLVGGIAFGNRITVVMVIACFGLASFGHYAQVLGQRGLAKRILVVALMLAGAAGLSMLEVFVR